MELEHEFIVPVGTAAAWNMLLDVERIGPCMPGATVLDVRGDEFTGTVKVKVGPIAMTYAGDAKFVERNESEGRVVVEAAGKESRGSGTAKATVTATLVPSADGAETTVKVLTDLTVTGRPAQFGRGMLQDIGGKLIGQFASRLAETLRESSAAAEPVAEESADGVQPVAAEPSAHPGPRPVSARSAGAYEDETIDLLDVSGMSSFVTRYKVPLAVGAAGVLLVWLLIRRRRRAG